MAYKLLCPECLSDDLEQHNTAHSKVEKFKCNYCGVVRPITHMQYEEVRSESQPIMPKMQYRKMMKSKLIGVIGE